MIYLGTDIEKDAKKKQEINSECFMIQTIFTRESLGF